MQPIRFENSLDKFWAGTKKWQIKFLFKKNFTNGDRECHQPYVSHYLNISISYKGMFLEYHHWSNILDNFPLFVFHERFPTCWSILWTHFLQKFSIADNSHAENCIYKCIFKQKHQILGVVCGEYWLNWFVV